MMRVICLLLVSTFALKVNAQQYTKFNGYGFAADRMRSDSVSIHPSDTVRNKAARSIAVLNGVFYIADGTKWKASGTSIDTTRLVKYTDTASMLSPYSKLKSVGLTMPSAFNVANSPLTSDGTLAVSGAGTSSQYVRGDGQLASFPTSSAGGGASVSYYLNGSVNKGTFGGQTYYEMSRTAIVGGGTDFTRTNAQGDGLIAQFITDTITNLLIPGGNWNLEFYFNASSSGGTPSFYVELYKYDGTTFTLISSNSISPEFIAFGTTINPYFSALAVPETILSGTDRLAMRVFVNTSGKTINLHTENSHLCQIITTFTTGLTTLNGLSKQVQYFATGTSGTNFNISSSNDTHTFNLPTASATNTGKLSSANWTTFNNKLSLSDTLTISTRAWRQKGLDSLAAIELNIADTATMLNPYTRGSGTSGQIGYWNSTRSLTGSSNLFWDNANGRLGIGTASPSFNLDVNGTARVQGVTSVVHDNNNFTFGLNVRNNNTSNTALTGIVLNNAGTNTGQFAYCASNYIDATLQNTVLFSSAGLQKLAFIANAGNASTGGADIYFRTRASNSNNAIYIFGGTQNVGINSNTDAGFRLDVNGTARMQDALTVSKNQNSSTILTVSNTTAGTGSQSNLTLQSDATAGNGQMFKYSSLRPGYKTINSSDLGFYNGTGGNISILNDNASGNINFTAGGNSNAQLTIAANGNITQSINQNASTTFRISNTTSGTASESILLLTSNNGNFQFGKSSSTKTTFKTISANDGYIFNDVSGNISILNNFASGNINLAAGGSSTAQATLATTGNLLIGTTTDIASSKLTVESTTQGFLPPRMTTAQRDLISTPAAGLIIYNTSTSKHQGYNGSTWNDFY